jgi:hypothetical protein
MQELSTTLTPTWDVLTESVRLLVAAWAQSVPNLGDFIPDVPMLLRSLPVFRVWRGAYCLGNGVCPHIPGLG